MVGIPGNRKDPGRTPRQPRKIVDRTSSMSVGQVERFWVTASLRLFTAIQENLPIHRRDASLALQAGCDPQLLTSIAAETLEELIGK
ncbi:MAG TPA: hypothetical protein VJ553_00195 [Candidatus Paceibacterota bacterium]|nr:hypothetical protein [Candidatus Paceibacterota bacterium]